MLFENNLWRSLHLILIFIGDANLTQYFLKNQERVKDVQNLKNVFFKCSPVVIDERVELSEGGRRLSLPGVMRPDEGSSDNGILLVPVV